jgi:ATP/maltotriose-dependent transcriptional regulator MalT
LKGWYHFKPVSGTVSDRRRKQILFLEQTNLLKENKIRLQWMMMGIFLLAGLLITSAGWSWIKYKNHKIKQIQMEIQQFLLRQRSNKNLDEKDQQDNDQDDNIKKWGLTARENEILSFLSQGCSNGKIAEKLFISENTVKFHIKNIYLKLNVNNRMEALLRCTNNDSPH